MRIRPTVDVTVTAVAALIVEAVELTTLGELVPDLATDTAERTWSWRPAPGIESAGRIGKVWFPASEAVADGDPDEVLHGWFATAVAELATARLGPPPLNSAAPGGAGAPLGRPGHGARRAPARGCASTSARPTTSTATSCSSPASSR